MVTVWRLQSNMFIASQQSGFTGMSCFLCEWDSRARKEHWEMKQWLCRNMYTPGSKNIKYHPLVDPKKVLLPPLHIKLGLMKQFVKALTKESECFKYLCLKFPSISHEKITAGIFVGPQIRLLMMDKEFENTMNECEKQAWNGFKNVTFNFLGNIKDPNYEQIVEDMLHSFKNLGCNMSVKVHFLHSHLEYFPENLGSLSEEQGERFHQDIKEMEKRCHGKLTKNMMADFCWMLKRDCSTSYTRQSKRQKFNP